MTKKKSATPVNAVGKAVHKNHNEPFRWDSQKDAALRLVFDGRLTRDEQAAKVGIDAVTLWRWMKHPEFQQRLNALYTDADNALRGEPLQTKTQRLLALSQAGVIAQNALETEPFIEERKVGFGGDEIIKRSFNKDAADTLIAAIRDIAAERGERVKKSEVTITEAPDLLAAKEELLRRLEALRTQPTLPPVNTTTITQLSQPAIEATYTQTDSKPL